MNTSALTERVKSEAIKLGADLVGIAPVERWAKAPLEHSPLGIMPNAKSVIVCAVHIPDACIELGSEEDPRRPGTGLALINVSASLNFLAFRLGNFLEEQGWPAIPIPQTIFWNYRPSLGAIRGWMADMVHYYAAACAGLGEIGWHNLCITPEFGTRQRFVSIITTAPLTPNPMYSGPALCDHCLLCAKHCPTKSFDKEVCGNCTIEIEDKKYTFPNRNLWRCAIGENFQLDVLMPWPDKVNEAVILDRTEKAAGEHPEWFYGWKMGICIKACMNPQRRFFDKKYCSLPRRKRDVKAAPTPDMIQHLTNDAIRVAFDNDADFFATMGRDDFKAKGIDLKAVLPDAEGAIVIGFGYPERGFNPGFIASWAELRIANHLEQFGFSALLKSRLSAEDMAVVSGLAERNKKGQVVTSRFGPRQEWRIIPTSLPLKKAISALPSVPVNTSRLSSSLLTARLKAMALTQGAHLVGIAPAERIDNIAAQVKAKYKGQDYFVVEDQGWQIIKSDGETRAIWGGQAVPYNPKSRSEKLIPKTTRDYLSGAKSVIVIGIRLPQASVDWAGKGPGQKAGHYASNIHGEVWNQGTVVLNKLSRYIDHLGYKIAPAFDLCDPASLVYCGGALDLTANRLTAVAAGLGEIGWNGLVLTPEYGSRVRFFALITDASLVPDQLYTGPALCKRCFRCVEACPAKAIAGKESISIEVDGKKFEWGRTDRLRCDWAKRYGLLADEGGKYMGNKNNFPVPGAITPEKVVEAILASDRMQRPGYVATVERCFIECPTKGIN